MTYISPYLPASLTRGSPSWKRLLTAFNSFGIILLFTSQVNTTHGSTCEFSNEAVTIYYLLFNGFNGALLLSLYDCIIILLFFLFVAIVRFNRFNCSYKSIIHKMGHAFIIYCTFFIYHCVFICSPNSGLLNNPRLESTVQCLYEIACEWGRIYYYHIYYYTLIFVILLFNLLHLSYSGQPDTRD